MLTHIREPECRYVTLEDGNAHRLAFTDPVLFFETYGYPLLIDEFQRVPSILLEIKEIVNQNALDGKDNNGMFLGVDISARIKPEWEVLPKRWIVERSLAWFNNSRPLSKDYELSVRSAQTMCVISAVHTLLKRF